MKILEQYSQEQILKMFYTCGAIIFLVVGIANAFTNFTLWENMILSAKVSAIFMNVFNFVIAIFFYSLLKQMSVQQAPTLEQADLEEIFKEAK